MVALLIETSATLTEEILDLHDRLIGSFFTKSKKKYERAFAEQGTAINDKVWLYARVGAALVAARDEGRDAFKTIEEVLSWEIDLLRERQRSRKACPRGGVRSTGAIDRPLFRASALQPGFLETLEFRAAPAATALLKALDRQLNRDFARNGGGYNNQDIFVARFTFDLRTLLYSTFIGGSPNENFGGMTVDSNSRLYVGFGTESSDVPVVNAKVQGSYGGGQDGFLVRISDSTAVVANLISALPGTVSLRYVQGGPPLAAKSIHLFGDAVPFTSAASASWVTVIPRVGTTPQTIQISASLLGPGNYNASVTVTPFLGRRLRFPLA